MATLRQLTYMVTDELKLSSDDSFINEEHAMFVLSKYRAFLLKQHYRDIKKEIPESNTQTISLDLIQVPAISGVPCEGGTFLRTKKKLPNYMTISSPKIYAGGIKNSWIFSIISKERMQYVGYNKWLPNIIYGSVGSDGYLYFYSGNPQYLYLEQVKMSAVFENPEEAYELQEDAACDFMDNQFPIEESLVPQLVELTVKELSGAIYKPQDSENDANDDLSSLAKFLRTNLKSALQKQIEGD